ncbi:GH25 family lysozyme [Laspinema olomoucense]|uniref:GH25 family lysozyme n=1 Tax=Laspinema olomoucense TaxID=3231600 RepID=UPI0021BB002F|nr:MULTISPECIES: GH25 family lysozyme [unclassified Laspinema]MCT7975927.1 peptidoglycan-binding protein [Laspinema sp. D3d]MCT7989678.1 peptidoglycan-binding protein [Laspinema sp. D3a]
MCAKGIDVSDWQDPVNWNSVAGDGMGFAFTKATEGATFVADSYRSNWAAMKSVGLPRGAYHFYRAKQDPRAQADIFLKTVKLEANDLPPVLDIESTDGVGASSIIRDITTWIEIVEKETKRRPIIYTFPSFWERIGDPKIFTDYPLWIAHYQTNNPWVPGGWDGWTFWQYTESGKVSGINGGVDINWFNVCRQGGKGSHVKYIQMCLRDKGFNPGAIDGVFGATMHSTVMAFQRAMNVTVDGIVGIQTWAALVSAIQPSTQVQPTPTPIYIPTPTPTPIPPPTPAPPSPPIQSSPNPVIRLIDVCRFYQGFSHQNQALNWLQGQLSQANLLEFARRWRGHASASSPINFVDVAKFYQGLPMQDQAIFWLQGQLSSGILNEFARWWRSGNQQMAAQSTNIDLVDVCTYYQSLNNQKQALQWLQTQIPTTTLSEFSRQWRNRSSVAVAGNISLVDVCQHYQGLNHQQQAIHWLQRQIHSSVLDEFTRKWRS